MNFIPSTYLIILGLILIGAELLIGIEAGFDLVLLGTILVISGGVGNYSGDLFLALVTCGVLSVLYIFFGRKLIKSRIKVFNYKTNTDDLLGKKGVVVGEIKENSSGMIKVGDERWRAESNRRIGKGEKVLITKIEGVTLKVEKVK